MTIHAIPGHFPLPRPKTHQKPARFSSVRVGAYCIRPTDGHAGGRIDRKIAIFQDARVGRNSIRPTDGHARGRMNLIPIRFLIHRIKTNQNPDEFLPGQDRGVLHTPYRRPSQRPDESNLNPIFDPPDKNEPKSGLFFHPFDHLHGRLRGVCCCALHGYLKKWRFFYSLDKNEPKPR